MCGVGKAKAEMELRFTKDIMGNKEGFIPLH